MNRRRFLSMPLGALVLAEAFAQPPAQIRAGQRAVASFIPAGSSQALRGEFAVTEVKGADIAGRFSGQLCGPDVYDFSGRFEGDVIQARSTSKWGPISVSARRVSGNKFSGTFTGKVPGKVDLEILD